MGSAVSASKSNSDALVSSLASDGNKDELQGKDVIIIRFGSPAEIDACLCVFLNES